tara:strand:- start:455 stop:904 length:450 start_codon:yes stop_codon:yes gene_type:complete
VFHLILYQPEIPPNTGNIMRLSVNTGNVLHLIKPLGFSTDEKSLKRAGMDYINRSSFHVWENLNSCLTNINTNQVYSVSTKGKILYTKPIYKKDDAFIFGPESKGLPSHIREEYTSIYIPMHLEGRSLNICNAVSIVAYEAWRKSDFKI